MGCDRCNNTGYKGRTSLIEALVIDNELAQLISNSTGESAIREYVVTTGMPTLKEVGKKKVLAGITTIDEVHRETIS